MRPLRASSAGAACSAALALPLLLPPYAATATAPARAPAPPAAPAAQGAARGHAVPQGVPGSTRSLPLVALDAGAPGAPGDADAPVGRYGLPARDVRPFSLLGVVWDDPGRELHGLVQVRTRDARTGRWTGWRDLAHQHDTADPDSAERRSAGTRGTTAPLWVGDSDGVQVRVTPERLLRPAAGGGPEAGARSGGHALPAGLRLEMVDPGGEPATAPRTGDPDPGAGTARRTPVPEGSPVPEGTPEAERSPVPEETPAPEGTSEAERTPAPEESPEAERSPVPEETPAPEGTPEAEQSPAAPTGRPGSDAPYAAPRPRIVTRAGWGADESLRERAFAYTRTVKAAFVHHSATGNNYTCAQAPSVLRSIYRYHVKSSGWRDFGYNFAVDKCGTIYEGRAGGVTKPVQGAHTLGFNENTTGVVALGTFTSATPPKAVVTGLSRIIAWKLGLTGVNAAGSATLVSGGGGKYPKGARVRLKAVSGHRDTFATDCPGARLYQRLGTVRTQAARLQGR